MAVLRTTIFGRTKFKPFVSTWKTDNISTGSSGPTQIKLPLSALGVYDFNVNWGDGSSSVVTNYESAIHTYATAGTYIVTVSGICKGWAFAGSGDRLKILSVQKWGSLQLGISGIISQYFEGCANLTLSNVEDSLNTTGFTNFSNMFVNCGSLSTINKINEWDVSKVTNMGFMFYLATSFNQNIGNWNVGQVTNMSLMFGQATAFNQNIGNWNVGQVTNMLSMFTGATTFNQNIGNWDVSKVTNMTQMFNQATAFNQDVGNWNVGQVTNMSLMFNQATAFNQNIGNWNVSNVTTFVNFMFGKTAANFSSFNLDAVYNGWSSRPVKPGISISFGAAKHTATGSASKAILTGSPNNWIITDGGI